MFGHSRNLSRTNAPTLARPTGCERPGLTRADVAAENVASVYNRAGNDYSVYADGDSTQLFAFDGPHAYADRRVWALLDTRLTELRASGASSVNLLDAGCGPGTWLRRLVSRAHALGFTRITARGFDIAQTQIERAQLLARDISGRSGVNLTFEVADLTGRLPEANASVDITLCLYSVLSHLPVARFTEVAKEIARVTSGYFITTVRSIGSTPTAFIDTIENVRTLKLDHFRNQCEIEFCDHRHTELNFHLFSASELRNYFVGHFEVEDVRGLDLFHSRFAPDQRWNPASLRVDGRLSVELEALEQAYAARPEFIDHATHLLLVAHGRRTAPSWGQGCSASMVPTGGTPLAR